MLGVIAIVVLAIGLGALIWWGSGFRPTRPRPRSRSRGSGYMDTHRQLEERERRHHPD